jgi:hypothetical protein
MAFRSLCSCRQSEPNGYTKGNEPHLSSSIRVKQNASIEEDG